MRNKHLYILLSILLLVGCSSENESNVNGEQVVEAYGHILTQGTIDEYFGGIPDSSNQQWYIDQWLKDVLAYELAKEEGIDNNMKIDAMVEAYRKDLVLREYYRQNVMQLLDTVITQKQLKDFFQLRKEDYILIEPYARLAIAYVPNLDNNKKRFTKLGSKQRFWEKDKFTDFLLDNNGDLELPEDNWYTLTELNEKLPEGISLIELKTGDLKVESNEQFIYLVNVIESFQKGEIPPIHSVQNKLKERLLFERRKKIESDFKNKLLEDAKNQGNIHYSSN